MSRFFLALACAAVVWFVPSIAIAAIWDCHIDGENDFRRSTSPSPRGPEPTSSAHNKSIKNVTPPFVVGFTSPEPVQLATRICH